MQRQFYQSRQEIAENERKIRDCEGCFEYVETKNDTEKHLEEVGRRNRINFGQNSRRIH